MPDKNLTITDQSLGARVREVRISKGISQDLLGKHLGVTFQQVQKYERGVNRIAAVRLCEIAAFLGVTPGDLLQQPTDLTMSKTTVQICALYNRLPPAQQSAYLRLGKAMVGEEDYAG